MGSPTLGSEPPKNLLADRFVRPGMNKDVKSRTQSCLSCQRIQVRCHNKSPPGTFPSLNARFRHMPLDGVGPSPPSNGFAHLLTSFNRQFEEQPDRTEDGVSRSGTGALQGGHCCSQRDLILLAGSAGGGHTTTTTPTTNNNFPAAHNRRHHPPSSTPCADHGDEYHLPHSHHLPFAISNTTTAPSTSDGDSVLTCPNCSRTFTSHIGLVGHLRIHRIETGELVSGASTHRRERRLQCPHCPRAFTHRMGLLGHMRIHASVIHRDASTHKHFPCSSHELDYQNQQQIPQTQHLPTYLVLIGTTHAHHASARSVTCESIAQRQANHCQDHQHTPTAPDSTVLTAHANSHTAWAY
ncbi:unnamed protein product [Schistocephalus solidus]|uniref:C2H2-type domain-containing protein n=1 Tax=Schistocephalus solidus TaxID=70667 RepID=A0A183SW33_SCHSO|nr:unnamed protein product [Schistocephalus solidus]